MHLVAIGGSDAGISAAVRARELDPACEVSVVVADVYPNFSICGIPYYVSGEVGDWHSLAHRSIGDLEATGMTLRIATLVHKILSGGSPTCGHETERHGGDHLLRRTCHRNRGSPGSSSH